MNTFVHSLFASLLLCFSSAALMLSSGCGDDAIECTDGATGCACLAGNLCSDGLLCVADLCSPVQARAIEVTDPAARSCEVIAHENGSEVTRVRFAEGVTGTHIREAPNNAITFFRDNDTSFPAGAVELEEAGSGAAVLERVRCFDREGQVLSGDPAHLGG